MKCMGIVTSYNNKMYCGERRANFYNVIMEGNMMKKLFMLMVMLVFSMPVYAGQGGEGDNTGCNGQGNPNSPCDNGDGGNGGGDPTGGDFSQGQDQWQEQWQDQSQDQSQSQDQTAIGVGVGVGIGYGEGGDATATGGDASADASVGDITVNSGDVANDITNTNTNTNSNDVSVQNDVSNTNTNTAEGGDGGDASASAVVAEGAVDNDVDVTVNAGTTYQQVRQAPSIAQGSFAISGCSVGGNAGGSNKNGAAFLGFGWTPKECYAFMLAQAYQSIGQYKAVCDILRNTKVGKRMERDGIELPECLPELEVVVVPAPVQDMS